MDPQNPYAPPVETTDAPPLVPEQSGLALSEQGWGTVTSLAKWMRIVGVFFYIGGAFAALGVLASAVTGGRGFGQAAAANLPTAMLALNILVMIFWTVFFFAGATWLRGAAWHFYDGVLSNAEHALAHGFRKLRLYLIFYGILGIVGLLQTVLQIVIA